MENQKKVGRPEVEEKQKNINVLVKPSKVQKLGQRKTALLLKEIAELVNANESITLVIKDGVIVGRTVETKPRKSSCSLSTCSP